MHFTYTLTIIVTLTFTYLDIDVYFLRDFTELNLTEYRIEFPDYSINFIGVWAIIDILLNIVIL